MAELAEQGDVRIVGRAASADQSWHLQMGGVTDAELLRGMLEFVARNDSIRITPLGEATTSDATDGAYGFFTDSAVPIEGADESYGFFEPVGAAAATDDAYGFFEPLPETLAPISAVPAAAAAAAEESYGFFEPLPEPVATPVLPVASATASEAYGFFVDTATLPAATAVSTATPVAPVVTEKPAAPKRPAPAAAAKSAADTSIRVGVDKVDQLINLVGELVITQAMLAQSASQIDPVEFERLHNGLIQLERNTRDLQESVMSIRMMPMSVVFSRFPVLYGICRRSSASRSS